MFIDFPESHVTVQGLDEVSIPDMVTIHQSFDKQKIDDVCGTLRSELEKLPNHDSYQGKSIAISVGSRDIPELDGMVKTMCDVLKEWGAKPFIVPAMGSHANAVAEGQTEMIAGYGVTEEAMGVPIKSSMEVVQYGEFKGCPLYCDKNAMEADGIVIFNKVKPHTDFRGPHESGLAKMITIGIAKHKGCAAFHSFGFARFGELIPPAAKIFIDKAPVAFGVGVVQNAYDDICRIEACTPEDMMDCDARLLVEAKDRMAKFKFDDIDLLIIDEIGKNISGNGHDPNVTGRNITHSFHDVLNLKKMYVRGLTEEAHHNGNGLSSCDIALRRVLKDVDWDTTWTNGFTTGILTSGMIPPYVETDKQAVYICLDSIYRLDYTKARIVRIKNTLDLDTIQVSEPLWEDIKNIDGIDFVSGPEPMTFDADGNLPDLKL